jgi:protein transport protein SEC31
LNAGVPWVQLRRPGTDRELVQRADELNTAIQQGTLKEFCDKKISENPGAEEWQLMSILFDEDTRRRLTSFVGFSREDIAAEVLSLKLADLKLDDPLNNKPTNSSPKKDKKNTPKSPIKEPEAPKEEAVPATDGADSSNAVDSLFGESAGGDDFLGGVAAPPPATAPERTPAAPAAPASAPVSAPLVGEAVGPNAVLDAAIKRAVICGEFEGAVDCCFRFGRLADALLLAATGGRELFQRTQERYLALNASQPFVKVTRSIVNHQLQTLVDESDPAAWKETLAILVTYATADEFASLCDSLATRLKEVGRDSKAATLCFICAGNVDRTVQIWLEEDAKTPGTPSLKLQGLIEKISVLLVLDVCKQEVVPGVVGDKYAEYAEVLASQVIMK